MHEAKQGVRHADINLDKVAAAGAVGLTAGDEAGVAAALLLRLDARLGHGVVGGEEPVEVVVVRGARPDEDVAHGLAHGAVVVRDGHRLQPGVHARGERERDARVRGGRWARREGGGREGGGGGGGGGWKGARGERGRGRAQEPAQE